MSQSPFLTEINSLPELVQAISFQLDLSSQALTSTIMPERFTRIVLTGCGDSHHAAVSARFAFETFTNVPVQALTAMEFARYQVSHIAGQKDAATLVIGISVSGEVVRTIEALDLAEKAGATTLALTRNSDSSLARAAKYALVVAAPPVTSFPSGIVIPGTRSYMASLLGLIYLALAIAENNTSLPLDESQNYRHQLDRLPELLGITIQSNHPIAEDLAKLWSNADRFVFCGSGPNMGTAMFSAAKLLEASGDATTCYDLEEWAHLEYFSRQVDTPTFLLQTGNRDKDRTQEVAEAAEAIGRRIALISSTISELAAMPQSVVRFAVQMPVAECLSPLLLLVPGLLFAEARSRQISEPYFRGFGGGRSATGGGGISRIRTGRRLDSLPD